MKLCKTARFFGKKICCSKNEPKMGFLNVLKNLVINIPEFGLEWKFRLYATGWNKLHFASARAFVYTKMFAVHDRADKNRVVMLSLCTGAKIAAKMPHLPGCIQNTDKHQPSMSYVGHCYI